MEASGFVGAALVAAGGATGALTRYGITALLARPGMRFPYGILVCNVAGCLAIGAVMGFVIHRPGFSAGMRLAVVVGLLGSLTTFSTFGYDTIELARQGRLAQAAGNVLANVVLGLGAVAVGMWVASLLAPTR